LWYWTSHLVLVLIVISGGDNGLVGFCVVFWVLGEEGMENSIKGTGRTCLRELESYISRGKKRVGSKKMTLRDI